MAICSHKHYDWIKLKIESPALKTVVLNGIFNVNHFCYWHLAKEALVLIHEVLGNAGSVTEKEQYSRQFHILHWRFIITRFAITRILE